MTSYYSLITSLPRHSREYKVKQTPISRIQLEKRLQLLSCEEQDILKKLEFLLWQSWFCFDLPVSVTINRAKNLIALNSTFMNELIYWFLDLRSLLTALRLRHLQQPPPSNPEDYWFSRLTIRLIKNWNEPNFGLKYSFPWLPELTKNFSNNETTSIEDILLRQVWKYLAVIECGHYFDFEALMIYLLRWDIVDYWSKFNEQVAGQRLEELITQSQYAQQINLTNYQINMSEH